MTVRMIHNRHRWCRQRVSWLLESYDIQVRTSNYWRLMIRAHMQPVARRRALAKLFTGGLLSASTIIAMRSKFRLLTEDLASRISRIPEPSPESLSMEHEGGIYEGYLALNRWARLLLSTYIDERYCLVSHPSLKAPVTKMWPNICSESVLQSRDFLTFILTRFQINRSMPVILHEMCATRFR